ncbi:hypothetical protein B7R25_17195 [Subtercola boreus]|uniref:Uncharacterized protein n=1 Tax=Subtercola boreus TaxID=120213 RepID=A0A3E0W8R8_9MICO|nr:hypothetical protein B7R24_16880 [Subtercola boreus]RFA17650.1 hypothetical protein B7R23_17040 [Subtercola boreus]RFA24231.1 hypothetical protein B7R25_17195 [Subtercola boreus]
MSQFVFQRDEVLKNSFEIFINTDEYKQGLKDIASMFEALQDTLTNETAFDEALVSFKELHSEPSRVSCRLCVGGITG